MIQLNLLPDVKLEYLKMRRTKRLAIVVSSVAASISLTLLVSLFVIVNVLQRGHLNNLNEDIKTGTQKLKETPDLNKVLTIQNQLGSLPELHAKKPVTSRLFTYVEQVTPAKVSISTLDVDIEATTMSVSGAADNFETINKFVDTMKFTTYKDGDEEEKPAFSDVVLSSFGRIETGATYEITMKFDPLIYDSTNKVILNVPKKITTRSETEKPSELFKQTKNPTAQ